MELAGIGPGVAFIKALVHARLYYTFLKSATFGQWVFSPGVTYGIGTTLSPGQGNELPLYERFSPAVSVVKATFAAISFILWAPRYCY